MIPEYVFNDIEKIKKLPRWWIPNFVEEFKFKPYSLHFLIGPRRVGKTVALELLIDRLLREGLREDSIFYISCDEILDFKELGEILDNYLSFKRERRIESSLIILDEITFVEEWWRAVKSRIDKGAFKRDVLIISGSASLEILGKKELFVGRRGNGKDIFLLPMKFSEFLRRVFGKESITKDLRSKDFLKGVRANTILNIKEEFEFYRETGGYANAITKKILGENWEKDVWDWVRGTFLRLDRSEKILRDILEIILSYGPGPFTYRGISKEIDVSPATVIDYIDILEKIFLVKRIYQISPKRRILRRKPFKIIFGDISFYNALLKVLRMERNPGYFLENLVGSNLLKDYEVYYMRNSVEIDFVVDGVFIEVKAGIRRKKNVLTVNKDNIMPFLATL